TWPRSMAIVRRRRRACRAATNSGMLASWAPRRAPQPSSPRWARANRIWRTARAGAAAWAGVSMMWGSFGRGEVFGTCRHGHVQIDMSCSGRAGHRGADIRRDGEGRAVELGGVVGERVGEERRGCADWTPQVRVRVGAGEEERGEAAVEAGDGGD